MELISPKIIYKKIVEQPSQKIDLRPKTILKAIVIAVAIIATVWSI